MKLRMKMINRLGNIRHEFMKRLGLVLNVIKGWPFISDACPPCKNQCHSPYIHEYFVGTLSIWADHCLRTTPECDNMLTGQNTCREVKG